MDTRTLCLVALLGRDSSDYEIKKRLDDPPFCHFQNTGFGSIYPALTRFYAEGLIEGREQAQEKRPDKLVFSLTETGRTQLLQALMRPLAPDRLRSAFYFCLFMSELLPRRHVLGLIDDRIAQLDANPEHMASCEAKILSRGHRFLFDLGKSQYSNEHAFLAENRQSMLEEQDVDCTALPSTGEAAELRWTQTPKGAQTP
ncbi:MAG: PadR family transcriptional regulator [Rhodospirillales bacterium]|nr:PadR family transcriptional regulator [Rhodospirillales bacterium]